MAAAAAVHPSDETLQSYGLGKLDDLLAEAVGKHLAECDVCRLRVAAVTSDSFVDRLQEAQAQHASVPPVGSSLAGVSKLGGESRTPAPPPASTLPPGLAEHPDYQVLRELARGGMGVVYLAENRMMGRKEVLKVVNAQLLNRKGVMERFQREIRSAAQLHHPNIVTAYSATRAGESIVFSMQYVEGYDLSKLVEKSGPLSVAHACNFVYQAALGLQHAHEHGMVHRDIKPGNLMLARDGSKPVIKILDFGLAKVTSEGAVDGGLTHEGQMLGTPHYIAPEQTVSAQNADIRADIYSLGCTLYCLLTGHPPFDAPSLYELLQAHHSMDAKPLNFIRPEVPAELAAVVAKMLAKEPERRFQTPAEVAEALKPFFKPGTNRGAGPSPEISRVGQAASSAQPVGGGSAPAQPVTPVTASAPASRVSSKPKRDEVAWESLIEIKETEPSTAAVKPKEVAPTSAPVPRPPWVWAAVARGVLLFGLIVASVLIFRTKNGTIVFENLPEQSVVTADGNTFTVEWPDGKGRGHAQITIPPGKYSVQVKVNGIQVTGKEVIVESGGVTRFVVRIEPPPRSAEPPVLHPTPSDSLSKRVKNSVGMTLVLIPPGEFKMGCADCPTCIGKEQPPHMVRVSRPFYLGACEVTQEQYEKIMGKNPSYFSGHPKNPVETVSWIDAVTFCNKLSEHEKIPPHYRVVGVDKVTILGGNGYRLPTEAEWEYACRAGDPDNYPFRDDAHLGQFAWMYSNCGRTTHPVGEKQANAFGLHDMYGNVWEFCWDWLGDYPTSLSVDPKGPDIGTMRVMRGNGWWNGDHNTCRPSLRFAAHLPTDVSPNHDNGFRVAADGTGGLPTIAVSGPDQSPMVRPPGPAPGKGRTQETRTAFLSEKQYSRLVENIVDAFSANGIIAYKNGSRAFNEKIKIRGEESPHAIYLHPPWQGSAEVAYELDGKWDLLRGAVAICQPPDPVVYAGAPLTFEVEGDNRVLWRSVPVTRFDEPQSFAIGIEKVKELRLRVRCPGPNNWSWAVWQEPRLMGAEKVPGVEGVPGVNGLRGVTTGREDQGGPGHLAPKQIINSIGMKLTLIPAGEFLMGSPDDDKEAAKNEKPSHRVRVSKPFYLGVYEVTQAQYEAVMGNNPSWFSSTGGGKNEVAGQPTDRHPVEQVSLLDAVQFSNKLSEKEGKKPFYEIDGKDIRVPDWNGKGYRLPTEAEWEYACRANASTPTRFSFGDSVAELGLYGWFPGNSEQRTHPVSQKRPNGFGLYDMHGNVFEWCWDWYDEGYYSQSPADDPTGPAGAPFRVYRGGDWKYGPRYCWSAYRNGITPEARGFNLGFRLALDPPEALKASNNNIPSVPRNTAGSNGNPSTSASESPSRGVVANPPVPPAVEAVIPGKPIPPGPFRVATNGLAGRQYIDPVSFGPDWLGRNEPGTAVPWTAKDDFARLTTKAALGYPRLPVSRFVFEVELTVHKRGRTFFYLGDRWNATALNLVWDPKREMTECYMEERWDDGNWCWGGSRHFAPDQRVTLKLVVGDGAQTLFHENDPIARAWCWPTDCYLRIWSETSDSAVIHRCSLRPLIEQDVAACGWPTPPTDLALNAGDAAARLAKISEGYPDRPKAQKNFALKTTGTPMAWIPPGEFVMGSRNPRERGLYSGECEGRHRVRLTRGYWMAQVEVTQGEFSKVSGANPSRVTGSPSLPVDWVAWDQAAAYCWKLTNLEHKKGRLPPGYEYRLPTEAEWEYACRAGSDEDFSVPVELVWSRETSGCRPHEVAASRPNKWGLYDMHGNAMEWCFDAWYDYPKEEKGVTVDPFKIGQPNKDTFVVRGGAWWSGSHMCASHWRYRNHNNPNGFRGFRIVLGPAISQVEQ